MKSILIECPECSKRGHITIEAHVMDSSSRGLITVHITKGMICDHSIFVYIDQNLQIRDYFSADFELELPIFKEEEIKEDVNIPNINQLDIKLIKLFLSANIITFILRSIFLGKKILIISDLQSIYHHNMNFFNYITQDSFSFVLDIISKESFQNNKKSYKKYMIFGGTEIIRNINNTINLKKLKVEKLIVKNFIINDNPNSSLLTLKNEVYKAYILSESIVEFLQNSKENLDIKKLHNNLEQKYDIKVSTIYLQFLFEVVENYFKCSIPTSIKFSLKLMF